jgi:hypothetical protein
MPLGLDLPVDPPLLLLPLPRLRLERFSIGLANPIRGVP